MTTLKLSIPNDLQNWIDRQVENGRFANASEYIRDLIRQNQQEVEAIQVALIAGELSGESNLSVSDIISRQKRTGWHL